MVSVRRGQGQLGASLTCDGDEMSVWEAEAGWCRGGVGWSVCVEVWSGRDRLVGGGGDETCYSIRRD